MARPRSLAKMSLDALIKLRDDVTKALSDQAAALRAQLTSLTEGEPTGGRATRVSRKSKTFWPEDCAEISGQGGQHLVGTRRAAALDDGSD